MTKTRAGTPSDGITISFTRHQTPEGPISFAVHIQIALGGHRVAWDLTMLPHTALPIEIDTTQKLILLATEGEVLVDSSQVAQDVPLTVEERTTPQGKPYEALLTAPGCRLRDVPVSQFVRLPARLACRTLVSQQ